MGTHYISFSMASVRFTPIADPPSMSAIRKIGRIGIVRLGLSYLDNRGDGVEKTDIKI